MPETQEIMGLMENIGWTGLVNIRSKQVILERIKVDPGFADLLISKAIFHANGWHHEGREADRKWRQTSAWAMTCYKNERRLRMLANEIAKAKKAAQTDMSRAA